ncbi:MAG: Uma2 family endonuclease [Caldilineaceae bacterium]|nr:Uma2 family endonuclease [Caldilineaceae bacterium]
MNAVDVVSSIAQTPTSDSIVYPQSDGKPMADNTLQFRYITTIEGNLEILFADDPNVFVAGDLLWYPVEGNNKLRAAPDAMVVFGRPKGDRGSYLQWREDGIAPQVAFEILSPGNRSAEMRAKFAFYQEHGVEEYYLYDPDRGRLEGWLRNDQGQLLAITEMQNWISPRLGIRFVLDGLALQLFYPDGSEFLTFAELGEIRKQAEARAAAAEARADAAEALLQEMQEKLRQAGLL